MTQGMNDGSFKIPERTPRDPKDSSFPRIDTLQLRDDELQAEEAFQEESHDSERRKSKATDLEQRPKDLQTKTREVRTAPRAKLQ